MTVVRPNIPPDSCAHIDRVIELADRLSEEFNSDMCIGYNNVIKEELELIRIINTQLREASKYWYDKRKKK